MKRLACAGAGLVLLAGLAVAADPTIKEIMTKAHKEGSGLLADVGKALREDEPDWDDIQKETKELVELGTALGKNDPPKGEKDSWERQTKGYLDKVKTLQAAAERKDKPASQAAFTKVRTSCGACHMAHRPK
jgi:cytochrome c556